MKNYDIMKPTDKTKYSKFVQIKSFMNASPPILTFDKPEKNSL